MSIVYYTQQDEFDLVNSGQDCIGWTVVDQAGTKIGEVTEMLINVEREMVDSILIDKSKRIAAQDFALRDNQVVVRGIMHDGNLEMSDAAAATEKPHAVVAETPHAVAAETHNQPMPRRTVETEHVAGMTRPANENEKVIPIIEEELRLGKKTVESGAAQVRTTVTEKPVEASVNLREEHVTVERRAVDRPIENAPAAFKEGTFEVTEMAEVPVVSKEARVVEEVVVGKNVTEREHTVSDTVKRTDVQVDEVNRDLRNDSPVNPRSDNT